MTDQVLTTPKTLNAKPFAALLLSGFFIFGATAFQLPRLYEAILDRVKTVERMGWKVDWYTGAGCFSHPKCYGYVFAPLKRSVLSPLVDMGYTNLLSFSLLFLLLPALLLLGVFLIRKLQDAFKLYELRLLGLSLLALLSGAFMGWLSDSLPLLREFTLVASLGFFVLGFRAFPTSRVLAPYTARYATDTEVRDMIERFPGEHSILLGEKRDGRGVYVVKPGTSGRRELEHVLVVAPTRSGKGLHLQTLAYTWGGSLIIVDIKGEMHRRTSGHRIEKGPVYVLDPTGDGHKFDPFSELTTDEELNAAVKLVLETGDPENKIFEDRAAYAFLAMIAAAKVRSPDGKPFHPSWTSTLSAILYMLELGSKNLKELLTGGRGGGFFADALRRGDRWAQKASFNIKQFYGDGSDEKFRESSWNILTSTLQAMSTDGVRQMMSGSDFTSKDLVEGPATLYLRFPEAELKATLPVLKLIEVSLFAGVIRYIDGPLMGWSPNPILWAFDEAGAAPVPDLPKAVSTWAGRNMYALIYIQDLSQLEQSYETAGAETILSNTLQIFYVGNPNSKTAEYVSQALGKLSQESASFTYSKEASESRSFVARELVTADEFRQASYPGATRDDVFIFPRGRRPIWAKKVTPFGVVKVPKRDPVYPWKDREMGHAVPEGIKD
jgi:type IV secretion system protein VirD4